jgi:hypothetical protein
MKSAISPLVLALALAAPGAIAAEDMYRSVMPDGSVRYGESPDRGAKSVKRIPAPPASTGVITVTPDEKQRGPAPVESGGTVVLPTPPRERLEPAEAGRLYAPDGLPKRGY